FKALNAGCNSISGKMAAVQGANQPQVWLLFSVWAGMTSTCVTYWTLAKNRSRIYLTRSPKARRVSDRGCIWHRRVKTRCGHVPRSQTIPAQGELFPRLRSDGPSSRRKAPRLEL